MVFFRISQKIIVLLRHPRLSIARGLSQISSSTKESDDGIYEVESGCNLFAHSPDGDAYSSKTVPVTVEEFKKLRQLRPLQPENPQLLKVSILGEPNVGKSTLTNTLVKWKVCAVSKKVHTTRKKAVAVLVEENKQIIFLDTPGFVNTEQRHKHSLEPAFIMDPVSSIREADLIAVVIDIANKFTNNRISTDILEVLETFRDKKSILIMNKIDAMKSKSRILSFTKILTCGTVGGHHTKDLLRRSKNLSIQNIMESTNKQHHPTAEPASSEEEESSKDRGWPFFSRVFMVSALTNDGVDDLREYLMCETKPHDWTYHNSAVTDQHPHDIALMTVREKLLEYLPEEIPYKLDLRVTKWELLSTGCPKIHIKIVCPNSRHRRFVIGPGGRHISACADKSRRTMREAFRRDVVLHLAVA